MSGTGLFPPVRRIETPRLRLRWWAPRDASSLNASVSESLDHLRPWFPWAAAEPRPVAETARTLRRFRGRCEAGKDLIYGIFDPASGAVLGAVGLHGRIGAGAGEIGYWIHVSHVGRGLATEAAGAVVRVALGTAGLRRVEIHCEPANLASAAIPRKLGFTHQVTVPRRVLAPGRPPRDMMIWVKTAPAP